MIKSLNIMMIKSLRSFSRNLKGFLRSSSGQMSLGTLMAIFVVIIVFSALTPTLNYFVNYGSTQLGVGSMASTIIELWPMAIVVSILWGIFIYSRPYAERYMGA